MKTGPPPRYKTETRMQIGQPCLLIDALADWGKHEAFGRLRSYRSFSAQELEGEVGRLNACISLLLSRPVLVALVLLAEPCMSYRAVLEVADIPSLRSFDGRPADEYTDSMLRDSASESGSHVRVLAQQPGAVEGPILVIGHAPESTQPAQINGLLGAFDGNHRMAAWIAKSRAGEAHPLSTNLILTRRPIQFMRREPETRLT